LIVACLVSSSRLVVPLAALLFVIGETAPAAADVRSRTLVARGSEALYNLDRERALSDFREAIAADPSDAAAHRGLAAALWMSVTFQRGTLIVDYYLGRITRDNVKLPPPPPDVEREFQAATERAVTLARSRLAAHPNDADATYQLGAAIGLRASYSATVHGSVRAAFGAARQAFDAHEKVLELAPGRHDAGLIVGTYRYLVSSLAAPARLVAYVAGFGGGRERGLQLIENAAGYHGDNQADAQLALVLIYNRERRYGDALAQLAVLRQRYPRNRLLWLETGSTHLRAAQARDADRYLTEGIDRLTTDSRPRMFGEESLWYYKRGAARSILGRATEAEKDLRHAVAVHGREWVHGRARTELAKLALRAGHRAAARTELQQAIALCQKDRDATGEDEARRLLAEL
jgi:tetratricopeptide (TPR) repeat protein